MKYNELHYERINLDETKIKMSRLVKKFNEAKNADEQIDVIMKIDNVSRDYSTYQSMASLNFSRNINDENAKAEKEYYDSITPDMTESYNLFDKALNASSFKKEISENFGDTFLNQIELNLKTFDSKIKEMLKEEINLKNEYTKLTAGAKIEFDGQEYNLAGLGPFHSDRDRGIRKKSYEARFDWFKKMSMSLIIYMTN